MSERNPVPVVPVKPRGRPRMEDRMEQVGVCLPRAYVQRLEQIAEQRDMKVSALVRQLLTVKLPPE